MSEEVSGNFLRAISGISCLCSGQTGSGKLLVLLHGIGSNAASFVPLMERLSSARPLLAWDAPGYGTSLPLESQWPSATDYAERLAIVLSQLGVERCALLGHSLGAIVAARFASLHPDRVTRLVLVSPALGYRTAPNAPLAAPVAERLDALQVEGSVRFAEARAPRLVHRAPERPAVLDAVKNAMSKVSLAAYTQAARLLSCSDLVGEASRIRTPTLVAVGAEVQVTPPESCRKLHAALVASSPTKTCRFEEIANAGHAVCQDRGYCAPDQAVRGFENRKNGAESMSDRISVDFLRGIVMRAPNAISTKDFYVENWGLRILSETADEVLFRGTGPEQFSYFVSPSGVVIEFTCEVEQIDEATHKPQVWPRNVPEKMDVWMTSGPPTPAMRTVMAGRPDPGFPAS